MYLSDIVMFSYRRNKGYLWFGMGIVKELTDTKLEFSPDAFTCLSCASLPEVSVLRRVENTDLCLIDSPSVEVHRISIFEERSSLLVKCEPWIWKCNPTVFLWNPAGSVSSTPSRYSHIRDAQESTCKKKKSSFIFFEILLFLLVYVFIVKFLKTIQMTICIVSKSL